MYKKYLLSFVNLRFLKVECLILKQSILFFIIFHGLSFFSQAHEIGLNQAHLLQQFSSQQLQIPPQSQSALLLVDGRHTGEFVSDGIKLVSYLKKFNYEFDISSIKENVDSINIQVLALKAPDGSIVNSDWKIDGQLFKNPFKLAALSSLKLTISATLPNTGTYTSSIILIYGGRAWPIPLTIERLSPEPSIVVSDIESVKSISVGSEDVMVRVRLTENAGKVVKLSKPSLSSLSLVQSDKNRVQANYSSLVTLNEKGDVLTNVNINPRETINLILAIKELHQSGEFNGILTFSGPDVNSLNKAFTIYKKESWWLASFFISLGVLISYLLRLYIRTIRPVLIRRHQVEIVMAELEDVARIIKNYELKEQEVLQLLRQRLNEVDENIKKFSDTDAAAIIKEIHIKLDIFHNWVKGRRTIASLQPALQKQFSGKLDAIENLLRKSNPSENEIREQEDIINKLPIDILTAKKSELSLTLTEFLNELESKIDKTNSVALQEGLKTLVIPKIKYAQDLLDAISNDSNFENIRISYNEARLQYTLLLTDDIINSLGSNPPLGIQNTSWNYIKKKITDAAEKIKHLDNADQAKVAYENVYALYLQSLVYELQEFGKSKIHIISKDPTFSENEKADLTSQLKSSLVKLDAILSEIDTLHLQEARKHYEQVTKDIEKVIAITQDKGGVMRIHTDIGLIATNSSFVSSIPESVDFPFLDYFIRRKQLRNPDPIASGWRILLKDIVFTLVIMAASVALGIKILWVDNATWGGYNEYITAIIWGLGVSAGSEGIAALSSKIDQMKIK
ncbi:hypothetical protein [Cesiribacter sp. SM1]|uniref:hypothetical protein n=1 Tax=Cesiribacter sp. SM1 TaxID=2861196 RepID=UPI001CD671AA|nr:hypothetical protein [Cesiribacter sp. SM1]